jgi:hypothetical protein
MAYITTIDVGVKNLGICVFDIQKERICHWASETLVDAGRYAPSRNVEYVVDFVRKHGEYFANAKCVLV